jgi:DNA-binding transcriptional regulator of glucitol operon
VRQLALSPRWMLWHVLTLGAMITCGFLSAWQWHRAGSAMGSVLNVGYGLQWPVFALFFGAMWWRMLKMEATKLQEAEEAPTAPAAPEEERAVVLDDAAAFRSSEPRPVIPDSPSPFTPRPASVPPPVVTEDDERDDRALVEYNQMLAQLAARDAGD